jgi:Ser/Thr protein kinase RdoA (MazF antagonist)
MYGDDTAAQDIAKHIAILDVLARRNYTTERLVLSARGSPVVRWDNHCAVVTSFVEGQPCDNSPAHLRLLGESLGQLHAMDVQNEALPPATMRPTSERAWALAQLSAVSDQVLAPLNGLYRSLVTCLQTMRDGEGLRRAFIHNDAHLGNAIHMPSGTVVLIDWHGAGLGPAVVDVAHLIMSSYTGAPWAPLIQPHTDRLHALIDGYCRHSALQPDDLDVLPDAMRFRTLIYGASSLAAAIRDGGQLERMPHWWRRVLSADAVAGRARHRFEENLRARSRLALP